MIDLDEPLLLKDLVALIGVAIVVGVGSWQYRRTARREFEKPLREAQLKLFVEATSVAAKLATLSQEDKDWKEHYAEFLRLYYGPMAVLEEIDPKSSSENFTVEMAMVVFKHALDRGEPTERLRKLSLALAHACRPSLGLSWNVKLTAQDAAYHKEAKDYWKTYLAVSGEEGRLPAGRARTRELK
jgi:hypothetical protein